MVAEETPAAAKGTQADGENALAFTFFEGTLEEALDAAKVTGNRVLVDVGAYWCHPCHEEEEEVFSLPKVGEVDADGLELGRLVEVEVADAVTLIGGLEEIAERGDPIAALEAAVAAAPEDRLHGRLEARYRLGLAYALSARRDEAEAAYKAVFAGDLARIDGDGEAALAAALAAYRDLLERFPSSPEARRSRRAMGRELHKLHKRGRSDEAIESLEAMLAAAPGDVTLRASCGWSSLRQECRPAAGLRAVQGGPERVPRMPNFTIYGPNWPTWSATTGPPFWRSEGPRRSSPRPPSTAVDSIVLSPWAPTGRRVPR